jgi:mercuric ion transport protein
MTMQAERSWPGRVLDRLHGDAAKTALAAGGLLAAFGVASCCALPVALSLLGIGAASLAGVGFFAAPYQRELFYASVLCMVAAGLVLWRQRRLRACASGADCARPAFDWLTVSALALALGLLGITFWVQGLP